MEILIFLRELPTAFWTAILGIGSTILGILLNNWHTSKLLKIQLTHDAREKIAERKQILRREIYVKAAEEIPKATAFLISLLSLDFSQKNPANEFQDFNAVYAKLQLISDAETITGVRELQKAFLPYMHSR